MAKISPLKTAKAAATRSPLDELLEKPVKLKDRTPEVPKSAGKAAGGKLSEPKAAGNTVVVAADSTQPGSGEIRRMVEAGESLPTDLKGLVKVSDAIRAGASASAVKPFILSMGNKRKRQTLADGGSIHRRLKGTGYDGANRKGQFQKGRGKAKAGNADKTSTPQATGEDYVSKKPSKMSSTEGPEPGSKGTLGERKRAAAPAPAPTEPAKFKAGKENLPPPAFGPKRGVAAPKTEKGGVGEVVGKAVGKKVAKIALAGGKHFLGKVLGDLAGHPLGQSVLAATDEQAREVSKVVIDAKAGRWNQAIARTYAGTIPGGKLMNQTADWLKGYLERQ